MNDLTHTDSIIDKIHSLHASAMSHGERAIQDGLAVGRLLLDLKGQLPRGKFLHYISTNLEVSVRQCQRYMAAAEGRVPLKFPELTTKCDTMSHLVTREIFVPLPGRVYMLPNQIGDDIMALVECAKGYSDYFFVTVYGRPDTASSQYTKRPLESILVHDCLEIFGLEAPTKQRWKWKKSDGVMEAEETLYGPSDSAPERIMPVNAPRPVNISIHEID
jgi:hypothetical protein